jgi:outer membrane protein OmpA-like peptidoglycan-associated protein
VRSTLPAALLGAGLLCVAPPAAGPGLEPGAPPPAAAPRSEPGAAPRSEPGAGAAPASVAGPGAAAVVSPVGGVGGANRVRLEITGVDGSPAWTTVYWRLTNVSAAAVRPPPGLAAPTGAAGRARLVAAPGNTVYHPLVDGAGRCLCSRLTSEDLPPGRAVTGFVTFPALPAGPEPGTGAGAGTAAAGGVPARTVRVEMPAYGFSREVPVRAAGGRPQPGQPATRPGDDGTGFTVDGIDRLPYATVLRVRKRPTRPDQVPLVRPERLATSPAAPLAGGEVVLVDPRTRTAYTPRYGPRRCMCADFTAGTGRDGAVRGVYVFPYVPAAPRLRVWFTGGLPLDDVAVRDAPPPTTDERAPATPAWPQPVWPPARPAEREVAAYPHADRVGFAAVTDRPGTRREESAGPAGQVRTAILFGFDSAEPGPAGLAALRGLAGQISARPDIKGVRIAGHADPTGDAAYNRRLSWRRARAVADLLDRLVTRTDVAFSTQGYGEAPAGGAPTPLPGPADDAGSGAPGPGGWHALNRSATVTLPR